MVVGFVRVGGKCIGIVTDTVCVRVDTFLRIEREGVLAIGNAVVIVVRIRVVARAVSIGILGLGGVDRKRVFDVGHAIPIVVRIDGVPEPVVIRVERPGVLAVGDAIPVVVVIGEAVAQAIAIGIDFLPRVERKGIGIVPQPVVIGICPLVRVKLKGVQHVGSAVAIIVPVKRVRDAVVIRVARHVSEEQPFIDPLVDPVQGCQIGSQQQVDRAGTIVHGLTRVPEQNVRDAITVHVPGCGCPDLSERPCSKYSLRGA